MNRNLPDVTTLFLLALLLQFPALVAADEGLQGEIRLAAASQRAAWVGQEVEIHLELWTDGFSFSDQWFVLPDVAGGYLLQADSTTVKLTENRSGSQWQGLRYSLLFYPQRAGRLEIPSFEVRFGARAGFGSEPAAFGFPTPGLTVESRLPPGTDASGLLVTTRAFTMEASWTPRLDGEGPAQLQVGDAVTLRIERSASDVPGMVFAPLPQWSLGGLGVYPEPAQVNDRVNRGDLTGVRVDSVTFICEREGRFTLPELRFQWWDPDREILSEKVIAAQVLEVAPSPAFASGDSGANAPGFSMERLAWLLGLALAAVLLGPRMVRRFAAVRKIRREHREAGEAWAFAQVKKACDSASAAEAYNAVTVWLARWRPARPALTLSGLSDRYGDDELKREILELQHQVADGSAGEWSGRRLGQLLAKLRKRPDQEAKRENALHPLNPSRFRSA